MRFRTNLEQAGKTATGFEVPTAVVEGLGAGKRPPVRVTIKGHMYRSTVASMGGRFMVGVSAENREAAGIAGGDGRRRHRARKTFDGLSYCNRGWHVQSIEGANTDETRRRRIAKSIAALHDGRPR